MCGRSVLLLLLGHRLPLPSHVPPRLVALEAGLDLGGGGRDLRIFEVNVNNLFIVIMVMF